MNVFRDSTRVMPERTLLTGAVSGSVYQVTGRFRLADIEGAADWNAEAGQCAFNRVCYGPDNLHIPRQLFFCFPGEIQDHAIDSIVHDIISAAKQFFKFIHNLTPLYVLIAVRSDGPQKHEHIELLAGSSCPTLEDKHQVGIAVGAEVILGISELDRVYAVLFFLWRAAADQARVLFFKHGTTSENARNAVYRHITLPPLPAASWNWP